ncbi:porin [Aquabacterium sp.]|jgi:predicted porin|uniref:porin n=1 Tax=Aquabacterium sp. TaxID=1872578 RepID=UPI0025BA2A19|nr:porin [Aquabacterium sp.]
MFKPSHLAPAVLLALAATAQAQSSVSAYGVIDLALGSYQPSSTSGARTTKVEPNQLTTSYIGFKGVEDLGDGLKAGFALEGFLRPDTGASGRFGSSDPMWSRNANVYLQGGFGKVTLGRQIDPLYLAIVQTEAFGGSFGLSPITQLTFGGSWGNDLGDSGWSNAVSYAMPTMGGFSATAIVQTGEDATKAQRSSYGLHARYAAGPVSVVGAWQSVGSTQAPKAAFTAGQRQNFGLLGATYDAGFAKFFAQYGELDNSGFTTAAKNIDTKVWQLSASVPVTTAGKVLTAFGQSKERPSETSTSTTRVTHNIFTLGYDHNLSKRTDVYAAYMFDQEKVTGYKKGHNYTVGIRHAF